MSEWISVTLSHVRTDIRNIVTCQNGYLFYCAFRFLLLIVRIYYSSLFYHNLNIITQ